MFSRRRPPPNPAVDRSTHAAATTAATSAFLQKSSSITSLSSAAAAAALRSHTTSPEPVANTQTKRMIRRGSTSSNGSTSVVGNGNGRPALNRTTSNGSMTERTFRSPSPATAAAPGIQRPASSLDASTRIASPPPTNGKRSSSADEAARPPLAAAARANRLSNVAEVEEGDKAPARNFSRPAAPEASSPGASGAAQKYTHGMGAWFTQGSADSRSQNSDGRTYSMPSSVRSNATSATTRSTQKGSSSSAEGSHLARATDRVYGIAPGTAYTTPPKVYDPNTRSFVYSTGEQPREPESPTAQRSKPVGKVYDPNTRSFVPKQQAARTEVAQPPTAPSPTTAPPALMPKKQRSLPAVAAVLEQSSTKPARSTPEDARPTSPRAGPTLHKQPSVVREDPEAEQRAEAVAPSPIQQGSGNRQSAVLPAKTYVANEPVARRSASLDVPSLGMEPQGRGRNTTPSPQRSAHFSPSPVIQPQRHVPPPRDVSPAKSAMKHSPASSERGTSPVANFSPLGFARVASPASETSETPSLASQDGVAKARKKAFRVSFDEKAQEIAAPAVVASVLAARSDEEVDSALAMQPRRALPSFESVRRERMQPEPAEKVTEMPPERREVSSDHAIGGILRNSLEPLPPEVTSKESAGYGSDESSEADVPVPTAKTVTIVAPEKTDRSASASGEPSVRDFGADIPITEDTDVPAIALFPPTPRLDDDSKEHLGPSADGISNRNSMEGYEVPGGWSRDVEEPQQRPTAEQPAVEPSKPTPEIFDGERQVSTEESVATLTITPIQLTSSPLQLSDIDEDSDDSAEFSDALEDPSDLEDEGEGGFASLDAILESPMAVPVSPSRGTGRALEPEIPESPSTQLAAKKAVLAQGSSDSPSSPSSPNWDEATAYWSQLTREKREQIEREHLPSDEEAEERPAANAAKKLQPKSTQPVERQAVPASTPKTKQPGPSALKKTMRSQPAPIAATPADSTVHMRRSMRDGGGGMSASLREAPPQRRQDADQSEPQSALGRKTMRASAGALAASSAGTAVQAARPQSQQSRRSQDSTSLTTLRTKPAPQPRTSAPPQVSARLQKELAKADDSDSESSFKKRRRARSSTDSQGRYSMKRSMRDSSVDPPPPASPIEQRPSSPTPSDGARFGRLRSMSPQFSRSKPSAATQSPQEPAIRTTLRNGPAATAAQPRPRQAPARAAPRYKSRFADSDDEDEEEAPKRSFFRSRFADSDDEDEPASGGIMRADLTPVRGIPRRRGQEDGDSTELEDEEDDVKVTKTMPKSGKKGLATDPSEVDKVMELARRNLGMTDETTTSSAKEGDALQKGSLRGKPAEETAQPSPKPADISFAPPEKKKSGFMSSILRRNRNSSSSIQQLAPASPSQAPAPPVPAPTEPASPAPAVVPLAVPVSPRAAKVERPVTPRQTSSNPASPSRPSIGKLRKNSYPPKLKRGDSNLSETAAPTSPPPQPSEARLSDNVLDSWARPTSPRPAVTDRPLTSDGFSSEAVRLAQTLRPDLAPRSQSHQLSGRKVQIQAGEEGSEPGEREPKAVYSQRTGKKKKFGTMRRIFGLND